MKYLPMPLYIAAGFILSIGCSNQPLATKNKKMCLAFGAFYLTITKMK
jgi:hypothetical protein